MYEVVNVFKAYRFVDLTTNKTFYIANAKNIFAATKAANEDTEAICVSKVVLIPAAKGMRFYGMEGSYRVISWNKWRKIRREQRQTYNKVRKSGSLEVGECL